MTTQTRVLVPVLSMLLGAAGTGYCGQNPSPQQPTQSGQKVQSPVAQPHVDLVIALDTSSSMDGLIDSARAKLWDIVNLLARAKPQPVLRIGLISYGNDGYNAQVGWVRKEADLTSDLDSVYAKLFALTTNGGTEYVARAVHDAIHDMQWDKTEQTLRIVFVAGNEPANQDPTLALDAVGQDARAHHIRVNTIYCGSEGNLEKGGWQQLALLGNGGFNSIDQSEVAAIPTPMDAELAKLSAELNETYVAYGKAAHEKKENQARQDANASAMGAGSAAGRASAKASPLYDAKDWDLVDAQKGSGGKALAAMPAAALPAEVAALPPAAREAFVADKAKKRAEIQKKIATLGAQRDHFVKQEKAKRAKSAPAAFDDAMNATIRTQAEDALHSSFE